MNVPIFSNYDDSANILQKPCNVYGQAINSESVVSSRLRFSDTHNSPIFTRLQNSPQADQNPRPEHS